jgi:hypothetical protein
MVETSVAKEAQLATDGALANDEAQSKVLGQLDHTHTKGNDTLYLGEECECLGILRELTKISSGTAHRCADSCGHRSHGILFKVPRLRRYRTTPNKATLIKIKVLVTTKSFLKIVPIILVSRAGRSVAACISTSRSVAGCISRWLTCSAISS